MGNVLIIAAHPDDEILGVGATAAKRAAQGDRVCGPLPYKSGKRRETG